MTDVKNSEQSSGTDGSRAVTVPDELGAIGFRLAADLLEDEADRLAAQPMIAVSFQQMADWLRQVAVQVPEAA